MECFANSRSPSEVLRQAAHALVLVMRGLLFQISSQSDPHNLRPRRKWILVEEFALAPSGVFRWPRQLMTLVETLMKARLCKTRMQGSNNLQLLRLAHCLPNY